MANLVRNLPFRGSNGANLLKDLAFEWLRCRLEEHWMLGSARECTTSLGAFDTLDELDEPGEYVHKAYLPPFKPNQLPLPFSKPHEHWDTYFCLPNFESLNEGDIIYQTIIGLTLQLIELGFVLRRLLVGPFTNG